MKIATDIGGTFTDLVYIDKEGSIQFHKSNTTPSSFEQGVLNVINESGINKEGIKQFVHGSTVVINTITERKGVKTGLLTTKGFRDVLEIARGNRPDLFNIRYVKPEPFIPRMYRNEVLERIDYQGNIIESLKKEELIKVLNYFKKEGIEAIAICFLHSYINPIHEIMAKEWVLEEWPEVHVTLSHEISKEMREYERTNTAVLNAYVKPIANSYLNKLEQNLDGEFSSEKFIMQSNGGTSTFDQAKKIPINMLESGPVAGIHGANILGNLLGEPNIIAFDIGGTTAKCSLISNGEMKISTDYSIEKTEYSAGYPVKVPVVDIIEIGNGGGSIAWIDEVGSLKVGPISAGSEPGPLAYGNGGTEPTTTDANLITGRLSSKNFKGEVSKEEISKVIKEKIGDYFNLNADDAGLGIIRIANSNMLSALRLISTRSGYDPRDFTMVAFGGGGSMHAASLAKELGIKKVIIPFASPVFSAWGMLMTDFKTDEVMTFNKRIEQLDFKEIALTWSKLESNAKATFEHQVSKENIIFTRFLDIRYVGQEHTVKVGIPNKEWTPDLINTIQHKFNEAHERAYSFKLTDTPIEIVNLHVSALGNVEKPSIPKYISNSTLTESLKETRPVYFEKLGWVDTPIYNRFLFPVNKKVIGPLIIEEEQAVTLVEHEQCAHVDEYGNIIIEIEGGKNNDQQ